jgi:hypothetical protein
VRLPSEAAYHRPSGRSEAERWRDKHGLAEHFSCGIRWIEERMAEGMPYSYIAGRAKFKISRVEPWLERHGFIEDRGGAA